MPRVGETGRSRFEAGFARSKRGNLWRHYDGMTLTVFRRKDDFYSWCIHEGEDEYGEEIVRFAGCTFDTEDEVLEDLCEELFC